MLNSVSRQNSLIVEDLCLIFNNVLLSKVVPPKELSASRLVALIMPNMKIRPIAVGEAIYRLFASVVFGRISNKAKDFFHLTNMVLRPLMELLWLPFLLMFSPMQLKIIAFSIWILRMLLILLNDLPFVLNWKRVFQN
ncbi:hypothetical protein GEMRC1_004245 [Eukaryota sp. GEM-RC1]